MKNRTLILLAFVLCSCATFRDQKDWAEINKKNIPLLSNLIKKQELKEALQILKDSVDFDQPHDYHDKMYIYNSRGLLQTLDLGKSNEVMGSREIENLKSAIIHLNELYKCSKITNPEFKECISKMFMTHGDRVNETSLYSEEDKKSVIDQAIELMCGTRNRKEELTIHMTSSFIPNFAFNSSYADNWTELKSLRQSSACR